MTPAAPRLKSDTEPKPIARALDHAAFACLWAVIFAVPWEDSATIGGFVVSHWLGILSVAAAGLRLAVRGRIRTLTPLHYGMAAFVAWAGLSFLWTKALDMTATRVATYVQLLILVWLIWELAPEEKQLIALARAYSLGAGYSATNIILTLLGYKQSAINVDYSQLEYYGRYAPEGFNQNELALLLALSIPLTLYLTTKRQPLILEALCWIQLVLCATGILLTGSRAGLVCLALASTMLLFALPHYSLWKKNFSLVAIGCAVATALIAVPPTTWQRLFTLKTEVTEGTLNERTVIWAAGLSVFRDHPFVGVGAGAYGPSVLPKLDIAFYAHNSFLSILVELGVVGALILLGLLAGLFYAACRMPRPQKWMWVIMLATWATGVFSLSWEFRKPTWFLFGMLAAYAGMAQRKRLRTALAQHAPERPLAAPARAHQISRRPRYRPSRLGR